MVGLEKKITCFVICMMLVLFVMGCGNTETGEDITTEEIAEESTEEIEETESEEESSESSAGYIDLTVLSSTMVYAEVYSMLVNPADYMGMTVKMEGQFVVLSDESGENVYTACLIYDALACCAQGVEFILEGDAVYPDDYPELYTDITVTGVFETYFEGETEYIHLVDAVLE